MSVGRPAARARDLSVAGTRAAGAGAPGGCERARCRGLWPLDPAGVFRPLRHPHPVAGKTRTTLVVPLNGELSRRA